MDKSGECNEGFSCVNALVDDDQSLGRAEGSQVLQRRNASIIPRAFPYGSNDLCIACDKVCAERASSVRSIARPPITASLLYGMKRTPSCCRGRAWQSEMCHFAIGSGLPYENVRPLARDDDVGK